MNDKPQKKILIVEDNELNLKLFEDLLNSNGFITLHTKDGFEAISIIKKEKPDLIIMDIQLRGISGFDVIKQIKNDKKLKLVPIIAVTAFAMKNDRDIILASGCDAYLPKPISINDFLDTVNKYV